MGRVVTWPERLDLILDILARTPHGRIAVGAMLGVISVLVIIIAAIIAVANDDARHRDVYYEDYIGSSHRR